MENSFKKISDFILNNNKLKFKGLEKSDVGNNIDQFFKSFFSFNNKFVTIDAETSIVQTRQGKRRTITDIYLITKYYFPRIRLSTVYSKLSLLLQEKLIVSSLCDVLHARVYREAKKGEYGFNGFPSDEFKIDFNEFFDTKSFNNSSLWGSNYEEDTLIYKL